ncbi:RDD family protein [compost metagenome]
MDLGIRGLMLGSLLLLLSQFGQVGMGLIALLLFVLNWWYMVLFEVFNQGRSPGKHMMGLRVVQDDGTPVGWSSSLIRNLLRFVDMLPLGYCLGAFSCLQHPAFKRLGDLAAGTLVIYRELPVQRPLLPDVPVLLPAVTLSLAEQRAIVAFAERQASLTQERARELAGIVAQPLKLPAESAVERLNGIARGLVGLP